MFPLPKQSTALRIGRLKRVRSNSRPVPAEFLPLFFAAAPWLPSVSRGGRLRRLGSELAKSLATSLGRLSRRHTAGSEGRPFSAVLRTGSVPAERHAGPENPACNTLKTRARTGSLRGKDMAKRAIWEFGAGEIFDGNNMFADVPAGHGHDLKSGTWELTIRPHRIHRASIFAHGVPVRDNGAFGIVLTHTGAVSLTWSSKDGAPVKIQTPDEFVAEGETVQITMSWGRAGKFSAVNLSRLKFDPGNPEAGYVAGIPSRSGFDVSSERSFTFAAADQGRAPYFHGEIERVTLYDSIEAPTVPAPKATVHALETGDGTKITPRRVPRMSPKAEAKAERPISKGIRPSDGRPPVYISTSEGDRPLSEIKIGDEVLTRSNGLQPVIWVGRIMLDWDQLRDKPQLRPIVIRKGALGNGLPEDDISLPPLHRLVVSRRDMARRFEAKQVLVSARSLAGSEGVFEANAMGITYTHLQFSRSQIIQANGIWVEAFNPFDKLRGSGFDAQRDELFDLFPGLRGLHKGVHETLADAT